MPIDPHDLAARLKALCEDMRGMDTDTVHYACAIAGEMIAEENPGDTKTVKADESLLDGIHWGHRAALTCEEQGGAIIRVRYKGNRAVSHEYFRPRSDLDLARILRLLEDAILPDHQQTAQVPA